MNGNGNSPAGGAAGAGAGSAGAGPGGAGAIAAGGTGAIAPTPIRGSHGTSLKLAPLPQAAALPGYRKHVISLYVSNKPGVLIRVALVFARRGYNIDSLSVNATIDANYQDPTGEKYSRMTIIVDDQGDPRIMDQIEKQLFKLVDVVKIRTAPEQRPDVVALAQVFRAQIDDVGEETLIVQVTGTPEKVDGLVELLRPYGIVELVRTGRVVLARGSRAT